MTKQCNTILHGRMCRDSLESGCMYSVVTEQGGKRTRMKHLMCDCNITLLTASKRGYKNKSALVLFYIRIYQPYFMQ